MVLKYVKSEGKQIKFGFIVSKKVAKKATVRNKVRRVLGELVRLRIPEIKKGTDAVLIALPGIEKKDFLKVKETVEKMFKKTHL